MLRCAAGRGTRYPRRACRGIFLGLGKRTFEFLEGELELVGIASRTSARIPQLVQQMFEAAVLL